MSDQADTLRRLMASGATAADAPARGLAAVVRAARRWLTGCMPPDDRRQAELAFENNEVLGGFKSGAASADKV